MRVLELFSGIGGMHSALIESGAKSQVKASIDINPTANAIYKHNYPNTPLYNKNIENLSAEFINKLDINTILMSPPCQPFTRNGLKKDLNDSRSKPFKHILSLLPYLKVDRILIENVKGFEKSQMRDFLMKTLKDNNYEIEEFIVSPSQFGLPNTRFRYYCLAIKKSNINRNKLILQKECLEKEIGGIVEMSTELLDKYYLSDDVLLKYYKILDICYRNSKRSCCFTKSYGRYIEGTGSVFSELPQEKVEEIILKLNNCGDMPQLSLLRSLKLRFFTPLEVCKLMNFPENFSFPDGISDKQKYMVLGNSINVKVVSELIKLLI